MPHGRKPILGPFTERKNRKAWNKTREKYMPVERRQNLAEADKVLYYKEEWLEELTAKVHFAMTRVIMNIMSSSSYYKIVSTILLQKLINDFAVCKHYSGTCLLVEDFSHGF